MVVLENIWRISNIFERLGRFRYLARDSGVITFPPYQIGSVVKKYI